VGAFPQIRKFCGARGVFEVNAALDPGQENSFVSEVLSLIYEMTFDMESHRFGSIELRIGLKMLFH
jgi:hypothetical protein